MSACLTGRLQARAPSLPATARAQHQASSTSTNPRPGLAPANITAQAKSNPASALAAAVVAVGATRRAATATAAYPRPHRLPPAAGAPGIPRGQSQRAPGAIAIPLSHFPRARSGIYLPSPRQRHRVPAPATKSSSPFTEALPPPLLSSPPPGDDGRGHGQPYTFSRFPRSPSRFFSFFPPALFPRDGGRQEQAPAGHREQSSSHEPLSLPLL